jgi:hypothetical protein
MYKMHSRDVLGMQPSPSAAPRRGPSCFGKKGPNLSKKKGRSRSQVAVLLRSEPPTRRYAVDSAFTGSSAAAGEGPTSEEHRMGTTIVGVSYNVMAAASSAPTRGQAPLRSNSSSTYARAAGNLRPRLFPPAVLCLCGHIWHVAGVGRVVGERG